MQKHFWTTCSRQDGLKNMIDGGMMRDPNRLENFYEEVKKVHQDKFPDWRFGQLISNFFGWLIAVKGKDCFFPEETEMLKYLKEYAYGIDE